MFLRLLIAKATRDFTEYVFVWNDLETVTLKRPFYNYERCVLQL